MRTRGAMWAKSLRLKSKVEIQIGGGKEQIFYWEKKTVEREGEKRKKFKLLSSIYGVSSFGIRWAKNESSYTRRGLHVGTKT